MIQNDRSRGAASISVGICLAATSLCFLVLARGPAQEKADAKSPAATSKFIGVDKCKSCHQAESSGSAFDVWHKSGHSKAYDTLASDKAKEIAKAKGIADPQKSEQCVKCHTTAFGVAANLLAKGFDPKRGIQCESCHGPGEAHFKARFAAAAQESNGEATAGHAQGKPAAVPAGEIVVKSEAKTCLVCHNSESPTFKPFCFFERSAKIAHLDPRKPRKPEEKLVCACEKCTCEHGCEVGTCGAPEKAKK